MKKSGKGKFIWIIAIVIIIFAVIFLSSIRLKQSAKARESKITDQKSYPVKGWRIGREPIRAWVFGEGTARSVRRNYLTFEQQGKVVYVKKREDGKDLRVGDRVKGPSDKFPKGEILARVDDRDHQEQLKVSEAFLNQSKEQEKAAAASLEQAKASYDVSTADLKRKKELRKAKTISESDYELAVANEKNSAAAIKSAEANINAAISQTASAYAQLEQTKFALERTKIHAPFDGVIAYLNTKEGLYYQHSFVNESSEDAVLKTIPIVVIDPSQYEITIDVPFFEGIHVKPGQLTSIILGEDLAGISTPVIEGEDIISYARASGKVFSVTPAISPGERSIEVKIRTTKGAEKIKDGLYVMCWIIVEEKKDALVAPFNSIIYREKKPYIFVIDEKKKRVEQRRVKEGLSSFNMQEITEGLFEGELLVTDGKYRLVNDAPVEIIEITGEKSK
jgi:RND family efflux transporter MFP subunit